MSSRIWYGQFSLTWRILAVNFIALALLAGGFFYIDSYRTRVIDERLFQSTRRMEMVRDLLNFIPENRWDQVMR